jgi:hypothetical protein
VVKHDRKEGRLQYNSPDLVGRPAAHRGGQTRSDGCDRPSKVDIMICQGLRLVLMLLVTDQRPTA